MTNPLVSASEVASLREYALTGMQTEIQIFRKTSGENSFNDDDEIYPEIPDETLLGWLRSQPDTSLIDEMSVLQHAEEGRLFLPVGTTLSRGDKVVAGGVSWSVIDTNLGNTYQMVLRAALRRES